MNSQSQIINRPAKQHLSREGIYASLRVIWAFISGGLVPIAALVLSILISLGLGVMAAEDWDGFAQRIDFGKMIAFYLSLLFGLWLGARAMQQTGNKIRRARTYGIALILMMWFVFL